MNVQGHTAIYRIERVYGLGLAKVHGLCRSCLNKPQRSNMVASKKRGSPMQTQKYDSPE